MLDLTGFPPTRERQNRINPRFLRDMPSNLLLTVNPVSSAQESDLSGDHAMPARNKLRSRIYLVLMDYLGLLNHRRSGEGIANLVQGFDRQGQPQGISAFFSQAGKQDIQSFITIHNAGANNFVGNYSF